MGPQRGTRMISATMDLKDISRGIWINVSVFILLCLAGVSSISVKNVSVPSHEIKGQGVQLLCEYDLEGDKLYSVKWYKGVKEFYRYIPADKPPMQVFEWPGVQVDLSKSNDRKVALRDISLDSSGKYKCEVSAEAPSFHTDSGEGELLVVDLPETKPIISGVRPKYHVGDLVHVNCTSADSKPPASLKWYINEEPAENDYLLEYMPRTDEKGLATSTLGLRFHAQDKHLNQGRLELKCTATIAAVYWQNSTAQARGHLTHRNDVRQSQGLLTGGVPSTAPSRLCTSVLALFATTTSTCSSTSSTPSCLMTVFTVCSIFRIL
ncbi:cell adhesion molecule 2-like [Oratosquilla oratoria]|uniref:cell adhesion molecule 2-like n=1 Tax=Oratosquilla oratoria TaxID=337810 RepID=UPI003F75F108